MLPSHISPTRKRGGAIAELSTTFTQIPRFAPPRLRVGLVNEILRVCLE